MDAVVVAVVTGLFGLIGIALEIRHLRKENTAQHGESRTLLTRLDERSSITLERVEAVSERLDDHLEHHQLMEARTPPRANPPK